MSHRAHSQRWARTASLSLSVILLAACSGQRPTAATWGQHWENITGVLPAVTELGDPPNQALCESTLAELRAQSDGLLPTPDATIDDAVRRWLEIAEATFFECPPTSEDISSFQDAYAELDQLEAEVDLTLQSGG